MSLPHALLARLVADPQDAAAWREALPLLEALPLPAAAPMLRRALYLFPTSGPVVLAAARAHARAGDAASAEAIILGHLLEAPYPPLYAFYCSFVEDTKLAPALAELEGARRAAAAAAAAAPSPPSAPAPSAVPIVNAAVAAAAAAAAAARAAVLAAYQFAAERVGAQWGADVLWRSYLAYTAALPTDNAFLKGLAAECQREALQRAATAPHAGCAEAWAAYLAFERPGGASNQLGEAHIARLARAHALAEAAARARAGVWGAIDTHALPCARVGSAQVGAWREALALEAGNPLGVEGEAGARAGVAALHRAALAGPLRLCPEAWYDYAVSEGLQGAGARGRGGAGGGGGGDAGLAVLAQAAAVMPDCVTLALAHAEALEALGRGSEAGAVLVALEGELALSAALGGALRAFCSAVALGEEEGGAGGGGGGAGAAEAHPLMRALDAAAGGAELREVYAAAGTTLSASAAAAVAVASAAAAAAAAAGGAAPAEAPPPPPQPPLSTRLSRALLTPTASRAAAAALPQVFILHQRQAQRVGGAEAARGVFSAARRSPHAAPAVYLASAALEYYANGRSMAVARNVLDAARARWPRDAALLRSAADFMALHDEVDAARGFLRGLLLGSEGAAGGGGARGSGGGGGAGGGGSGGLAPLPAHLAQPFWGRLHALELNLAPGGGALDTVAAVESRAAWGGGSIGGGDGGNGATPQLCRLFRRWGVLAGGGLPGTALDEACLARWPEAAAAQAARAALPHYLCPSPLLAEEGALGSGSASASASGSAGGTGSSAAAPAQPSAAAAVPEFLKALLASLPAYTEDLPPVRDVEGVVRALAEGAWEGGEGEGAGGGGGEGGGEGAGAEELGSAPGSAVKRARLSRWAS